MSNSLALAYHFVAECLARRYEYERQPEPRVVMDEPQFVREYRDAGLPTGNGSSIYLLNMLMLCGRIQPGDLVLDLACGPANLLVELAALNPQANFVGVDLSDEMLRWAESLRASRAVSNLTFVRADITDLTAFAAQSVDVVISTLSLHHLPTFGLLQRCAAEIARVVRPGGAVHLMDFASLKRSATARYFVFDRTKGLGEFLAQDYEHSLRAAFRIEELASVVPVLKQSGPGVRLVKTFGVPFIVAITSLAPPKLGAAQQAALADYWSQMRAPQKDDFNAMRLFFNLNGLGVPSPSALRSGDGDKV